ncbi:MAG: zinc metallopeptidase [Thermomicrobiales bacterium]|nr:zinc metallopeptidase [Thermomicrobiales bacterium]
MIFDPLYFVFMIPGIALMLWAQAKVKGSYRKYSQVANSARITGAQAARRVLDSQGLYDVPVEAVRGELTDHYDPRKRALFLSEGVYGVPSIAAIAVAAHEAGHAMQHAKGYAPLKARTAIVPLASIGSNIGYIVLILGLIAQSFELGIIGLLLFAMATVFALVTLPVEFDASARAKQALIQVGLVDGGVAGGQESKGVSTMLSSAAWTYVAGFAASLLTLLYYVMAIMGMRSSDD